MTTDQNPAALKAELRKETRDWLKRGVIPAEAAKTRRMWAEQLPANAYGQTGNPAIEWHLAVAAEWDRIAAKFPEKVRQAYEAKRYYHLNCIAEVARIGHLDDKPEQKEQHRAYHQAEADAWQARADAVN